MFRQSWRILRSWFVIGVLFEGNFWHSTDVYMKFLNCIKLGFLSSCGIFKLASWALKLMSCRCILFERRRAIYYISKLSVIVQKTLHSNVTVIKTSIRMFFIRVHTILYCMPRVLYNYWWLPTVVNEFDWVTDRLAVSDATDDCLLWTLSRLKPPKIDNQCKIHPQPALNKFFT